MKKNLLCLLLTFAMLFGTSNMLIACAVEIGSEQTQTTESVSETKNDSPLSLENKNLTDYVDMRYGTASDGMSIGPTRPNASVLPAPDTYPRSYSTGYLPNSPIRGFSQTHMSAGAEKYGNFLVSPQIGLATATAAHDSEKENENPTAAEYSVTLSKYDIDVAFTPTEHAVIYKFTYPESDNASLVMDVAYNICRHTYRIDDLNVTIEEDGNGNTIIFGSGQFDAGTEFAPYYQYFYAVIDKEATQTGTFVGSETSSETKAIRSVAFSTEGSEYALGTGAYMTFSTKANEEVYMKIGISFKSVDKAKQWLEDEIPEWDYDKVKNDTLDIWNEKLSVIEIGGESLTEEQKTLFYTSLYKSFINPRDRTGDIAKFGDYDMVDDHLCIWDTFRTLFPLYSIIDNEFYAKTVKSTIARLEVNGCVRDHYHAGYERMLQQGGDNIDNVIAEAYLKGIIGDIDWEKAYEVVKSNAENWRDDQTATWTAVPGKISTYITNGYIPADGDLARMCCSKTIEYAYNDYLAAQMAKGLALTSEENGEAEKAASYTADYEKYIARSNNWMKLWNPDIESDGFTGYIWPKTSSGEWIEPNADLPSASTFIGSWKPYFYEGTCYSYSFFVPHDIDTLIELMGGEATFISRLQTGINNDWIEIDNQPGFLQAFMFNHTSKPWHTSDYVEKMLKGFSLENGTPGYDDSGSLCAWYIFASVGFFPNAGQDFYYLTSPKYETTTFKLENGNTFTIKANDLSETNKYIQSVSLNGKLLSATTIDHSDIMAGGVLEYNMGSTPVDYTSNVLGSGSVAENNYEWKLRANGVLTITGTGDGTLRFDNAITEANLSDIPWYSSRNDIVEVEIAESTGIESIAAYALSNLPACKTICIPTTLTDLGGEMAFANNTALDTVYLAGDSVTYGVFNLVNILDFDECLFKDSSDGLTITLSLGNGNFAPEKWFTADTTVNFEVGGKTDAEAWVVAAKAGTADTRDERYKFTIGDIARVVGGKNTVASNQYSWTLDTDTGILTFVDTKSGYNELAFSATSKAFNEWVVDWRDEIEHIIIPNFDKFSISSSENSPFANLPNLKTVKIDANRWLLNSKTVFENCYSLTSLGTSSNFETGKINLSAYQIENLWGADAPALFKNCKSITSVDYTGFKAFSGGGTDQQALNLRAETFLNCTSLKEVIFGDVMAIRSNAFKGCSGLTEITVPVNVTSIAANAFADCTALEAVYIESSTYTSGLLTNTTFPDKDGLIIYCENKEVQNAINALGYTETKAVNVNATAVSGIKMEGFSIRTKEYNGLRGIFSFDNSAISANASEGLTLIEYGAILASEANKNAYGTNISFNGSEFVTANKAVIKKAVWANGGFVGNILKKAEDKTDFAVTIVNYVKNFDTNVCMLGYSIWQDAAGNSYIKYVDCENDDFDATSIYSVTLGMYKDCAINASDDPDGVIWEVLSACAATLTAGTDYRDGDRDMSGNAFGTKITFANIPLYTGVQHGSTGAKSGTININATKFSRQGDHTLTLLPDGDNYVAVFRGTDALPTCSLYGSQGVSQIHQSYNSYNSSGGTHYTPCVYSNETGEIVGYIDDHGNYVTMGYDADTNSDKIISKDIAHLRQPSPTLTKAAIGKIKTVIVDEGITKLSDYYFCNTDLAHIDTVIYASSVKSIGTATFMCHSTLVTMSPYGIAPTKALLDLTGIKSFGSSCFNKAARSEHMILLSKGTQIPGNFTKTENVAKTPVRTVAISTDRSTLTYGVADLRGITSIGSMAIMSNLITKVYFDDSVKTLATDAFYSHAMTVYTNAENVALVKTFAAANSNRSYIGGKSFSDFLKEISQANIIEKN